MFFLDANKTYNNNLGLSQSDRSTTAINEDFFLIDEFDFKSFIEFLPKYATQIAYFNEGNTLDGDWTSFFNNNPTLSLLKVAFYNISLIQPSHDPYKLKEKVLEKGIIENIFLNLKDLLNHFKSLELSLSNLQDYPEFKSETEKLIVIELSPIFNKIFSIIKQLELDKDFADEKEFSSYWRESDSVINSSLELIDIAKESYGYFKKTNIIFDLIKESAKELYDYSIVNSKNVSPHISLLIAFHNIYNEARENLNAITFRHHEHYLKNILQIPLHTKKPDKVHVNFTTSGKNQVEIKKGKNLLAGANEEGKNIIYKVDKTILINKAKLNQVIGFEFDNNEISDQYFLNLFENEKKLVDFTDSEQNIGFTFGSEFLLLEEGVRKVIFEFNFSKTSIINFIKSNTSQKEIDENTFLNLFKLSYSSDKEWVNLSNNKVETIFNLNIDKLEKSTLQIVALIDNIDPPITPLDADNRDFKAHNNFPMFEFKLNHEYLYDYHALKFLEINNINIEVEILEVKNLSLSNDFGKIDTSAPFEPFGSQPLIDSSFIVGHSTFFLYPINDLKINLEWYGLPFLEGGFTTYYDQYPWDVNNEDFEVKVSYLRNKRCGPQEDKQVINLFQDVPDDTGAVSNVRRINEINIRDLDLHLPSLSKKNEAPYSNKSKDGFLKFELCFPMEGFGHQQYPEILRESTMKSVKKKAEVISPNEPYTPTLKTISADFKMKMTYNLKNSNDFDFYHLHPIGNQKIKELNFLYPTYKEGSSLIIGINNVVNNKQFSILFQINEGFANKSSNDLMLSWSYFNGSRWIIMNDNQIIKDNTNGLKSSGIIEFSLENANYDLSGLFSNDSLLIKLESFNKSSFLNYLQDILLHVTTAVCHNPEDVSYANLESNKITSFEKNIKNIDGIHQKYRGFNGVIKEDAEGYFLRVAERLRHKNRAVSGKDYEKIILENFPQVNRVKCLSNVDTDFNLSPGNVLIVVVPKIIDDKNFIGIPRFFSLVEISRMEKFLKSKVPLGVKFKVTNPVYEQVHVKFSLKLNEGIDKNFYVQKLNEGIKSFISPWMFNLNDQVELGQSISSALILNFIDKQEYVDHVVNFSLFHIVDGVIINQKQAKSNTVEIKPTTLISILTSENQHIILPYEENNEIDNFGINEMMIDTDYVVDHSNKEETFQDKNLKIGKSYKIMKAKEDNKSVSSNFTFYITV